MKENLYQKKKNAYYFGLFAEYWVIFLYTLKGYLCLKHRYKTVFGEIDLIFKKGNTLTAVEVKARKDKQILVNDVVQKKQLFRIQNSLIYFISKNEKYEKFDLNIDIILIKNIFCISYLKKVSI